jgi:putative transposase
MPPQARIDSPGALHHIIVRGIERKAIFKDRTDRLNFLKRLGIILTETQTPCYG